MSRLRKHLYRVHTRGVALEDSVSQEYEPISDIQLQFLDVILGIQRDAKRKAGRQANGLSTALTDQDRQGMSGVHDSCGTGGVVDPHDLPGHEVFIIRVSA